MHRAAPLCRSWRLGQKATATTEAFRQEQEEIEQRILEIAQTKTSMMDAFLDDVTPEGQAYSGQSSGTVEKQPEAKEQIAQALPYMFNDGVQPSRQFVLECVKKSGGSSPRLSQSDNLKKDPSLWHMIMPLCVDYPRKRPDGSLFWLLLGAGHNQPRLRADRYLHVAFGIEGETAGTLAAAADGTHLRDTYNSLRYECPQGKAVTTCCFECLADIHIQNLETHDRQFTHIVFKANESHGLSLLFFTCSAECDALACAYITPVVK